MEKFWTDAKITEELAKKRRLKPTTDRRPKTYVTSHSLAKLVSAKNGFQYDNVREVLDDLFVTMWEQILAGNKVYLPKIGSIYLTVAPPYKTNVNLKGMGGGLKPLLVPPRYDLRFYRNEEAMLFLKQREVSEEELSEIYFSDIVQTKVRETEVVIPTPKQSERKM